MELKKSGKRVVIAVLIVIAVLTVVLIALGILNKKSAASDKNGTIYYSIDHSFKSTLKSGEEAAFQVRFILNKESKLYGDILNRKYDANLISSVEEFVSGATGEQASSELRNIETSLCEYLNEKLGYDAFQSVAITQIVVQGTQ